MTVNDDVADTGPVHLSREAAEETPDGRRAQQVGSADQPRPANRPTMKDIADRVGVSVKSVSRVLNGEGGASPVTTQRILDVASDLGFRRNDLARDLRRGDRTGTIGLVLRHSSTRFYDDLIRGVEEVAEQHGTLVITAGSRTAERERETLLALSSRRVDGLLVEPNGPDHSFLATEQAMGTPTVFVDRPPRRLTADTILSDDFTGGRDATAHLVVHGHHRIGVIGTSDDVYTVQERLRGHETALTTAGLPTDERMVRLNRKNAAEARAAATELLASAAPPTALFTLNSVCTIGAAHAVRDAGLEGRIALIGFDDFELADLLTPPVTVVSHDVTEMGRQATQLLFARIHGYREPPQRIVLPVELIVRGSGEIPGPLRSGTARI
jgi:LacI family transcriptional regulator